MLTEDGLFEVGEEMVEAEEAENIKDQFWPWLQRAAAVLKFYQFPIQTSAPCLLYFLFCSVSKIKAE